MGDRPKQLSYPSEVVMLILSFVGIRFVYPIYVNVYSTS